MLHFVSYDLNHPGQDYNSLIIAIKLFDHIHINGSCWCIKTNLTATQLLNMLAWTVDTTDNLIICDFHNWASYNLAPEVTAWLKK